MIARFWKETSVVSDFLHRCVYQGKIASMSAAVGWVWPDVTSQIQTYLNSSRGDFG